jgi:DNA primase
MNTIELKARIDIIEVLLKAGARVPSTDDWGDMEVKVFCPFCEDLNSHKPAGRANPVKGLYHCFNCHFGGDIIDIAKRVIDEDDGGEYDEVFGTYSATYDQAVDWLVENFPDEDDPWTS